MATPSLSQLKISAGQRYLVTTDGKPFFYLADTAWELFHRLKCHEADLYLENRATKGFTVIQAVVLAEEDGLNTPNANGDKPLFNNDPCKPNPKYFKHVDHIVNKANSLGIYIGMLPTWGDKVTKAWGIGPEVFDRSNAYIYGKLLGKRYKNNGIIWILGGDRTARGKEDVWIAMAKGLRAGDKAAHLITGHWGEGKEKRSSAAFFGNQKWLDINMAYSGHQWGEPNYELILSERKRKPVRPVFDGEPRYENHPYIGDGTGIYKNKKAWDGITRAGSHQMRQAGYWAMLAGACGHTYGCHDVWQMYSERVPSKTWANMYWHKAIHFEGSYQLGLMKKLFESRPWQKLTPDQSLIASGQLEGEGHVQSAKASDSSFSFVYIPFGTSLSVRMDRIKARSIRATWFNPRNGGWVSIGQYKNKGVRKFIPPSQTTRSDWVLVLDNAQKNYPVTDITIPDIPKRILDVWPPEKPLG